MDFTGGEIPPYFCFFRTVYNNRWQNVQVPASRTQQKSPEIGHNAGNIGATFVPGTKTVWSPSSTSQQVVNTFSTKRRIPKIHPNFKQVPFGGRSPPSTLASRPFLVNSPSSAIPIFQPVAPTFSPPRSYHEAHKSYPPSNYSVNSAPHSFDSSRFTFRPREGRHTSPSFASHPRPEFHPRLYPGSVRQAARAASLNRPSPPTEAALGRSAGTSSANGLSNDDKSISYSRHSIGFGGSATPSPSNLAQPKSCDTSEKVNWQELLGSSEGSAELNGIDITQPDYYDESSPTPRGGAPGKSSPILLSQEPIQPATLQVQNLPTSPSLATASSPASSALGHSPGSTQQEEVRVCNMCTLHKLIVLNSINSLKRDLLPPRQVATRH